MFSWQEELGLHDLPEMCFGTNFVSFEHELNEFFEKITKKKHSTQHHFITEKVDLNFNSMQLMHFDWLIQLDVMV
jgi:hypothetical protein